MSASGAGAGLRCLPVLDTLAGADLQAYFKRLVLYSASLKMPPFNPAAPLLQPCGNRWRKAAGVVGPGRHWAAAGRRICGGVPHAAPAQQRQEPLSGGAPLS